MSKVKTAIAVLAISGAAALPLTSAQAWWGGPFNGMGDGFGDGNMSFNMNTSMRGNGRGYGYNRPYYGYAPYGYAPAPVYGPNGQAPAYGPYAYGPNGPAAAPKAQEAK
ncbi:MAG TPA: sulfur globule protein CV1 [Chromatiales bacterium]|nr:sulfur globule protein CV1 [Chromatiales bacterium]